MASARFEEIAERYLDVKIRGAVEYMTACPFCSGTTSLQFNVGNGLWVCFRCGAKGNAKQLVKKLGGHYSDPAISVDHIQGLLNKLKLSRKEDPLPKVLDESYLRRFDFPDEYWPGRGFSDATIQHWQLGYDPISNRHTIPYRDDDGNLLGVIQRLSDEEREREDIEIRYIYEKGFRRKEWLFGSWEINKQGFQKAAIVEGSTDVVALHESSCPSVGQYGSSISTAQVRLLHRLGLKEVVLFYDYDEAGRKAEERARELLDGLVVRKVIWDTSKYCFHKRLCGCGEHTWRNIANCDVRRKCNCGRIHEADPGILGRKERRRMYENAELAGRKKVWVSRRSV